MTSSALQDIEQLEDSLWEAADQLRANSKLTSSEYCMPVLGVIFLRHANNRYQAARRQIEADQAAGKMPVRLLSRSDFIKRRALMLPEKARYDALLTLPKETHLGRALVEAMNAIEEDFEPLLGLLAQGLMTSSRTTCSKRSCASSTARSYVSPRAMSSAAASYCQRGDPRASRGHDWRGTIPVL